MGPGATGRKVRATISWPVSATAKIFRSNKCPLDRRACSPGDSTPAPGGRVAWPSSRSLTEHSHSGTRRSFGEASDQPPVTCTGRQLPGLRHAPEGDPGRRRHLPLRRRFDLREGLLPKKGLIWTGLPRPSDGLEFQTSIRRIPIAATRTRVRVWGVRLPAQCRFIAPIVGAFLSMIMGGRGRASSVEPFARLAIRWATSRQLAAADRWFRALQRNPDCGSCANRPVAAGICFAQIFDDTGRSLAGRLSAEGI